MKSPTVSVIRYENARESVRTAVELCGGLNGLNPRSRVFIKPNIVFWTKTVPFPKWGVITTSRIVHDVIVLLKEHGVDDITMGEGTVVYDPRDRDTAAHAFESLGYNELSKRYGVKVINVFQRPFEGVALDEEITLKINADYLRSDFLVDLPVLKTHAQTMVSLGIKNLKGLIDIPSRKKCHSPDTVKDLHYLVGGLAQFARPGLTLIDGIYTNERGPSFDGKIRRSDLLVASADLLSADLVGARLLGYDAADVPHLAHAARFLGRSTDLSSVEIVGERLEDVSMHLHYTFQYNPEGTRLTAFDKMGIKGLSYPKYDLSLCTYCSALTGVVLASIANAWKGEPWDDVEVLTGKMMQPTPGRNKTILIGKCLSQAHRNHPNIDDMIRVKGCPPSPSAVVKALHQAGIDVNPALIENLDKAPGFFMGKYQGKPEFQESLFQVE